MIKLVLLDDLILDAGTQIRAEINKEHVEDLAEAYREKRNVAPIDTFYDGGKYIVADGFHRVMGASQAGEKRIKTEVHPGKFDKALLFALGANGTHGLRRSNADKNNAVRIAIATYRKKSNNEIAKICGVSDTFVCKIRPTKEITPEDLPTDDLFKPSGKVKETHADTETSDTDKPAPAPAPKDTRPAPAPVAKAAAPAPAPVQPELNGEYDTMGYPLTKAVVELFNRKSEVEALIEKLNDVRLALKKVMDCGGDILYAHISISSYLPDLELSITTLKCAVPYAVCPYCQGFNLEQCTNCRHTGMVSKWMFERQIPTEIQRLRKIQIEKLRDSKKK